MPPVSKNPAQKADRPDYALAAESRPVRFCLRAVTVARSGPDRILSCWVDGGKRIELSLTLRQARDLGAELAPKPGRPIA